MSVVPVVSVLGAGEIGAAAAYALARRSRVREVRLIDTAAGPAAGKALDMRQSGPIDRFDTPISSRGDVLDAVNADVIVIADAFADGEWEGERGLALIKQLLRAGTKAPIVCAGPRQGWLMEAAVREAGVPADRIVGSASSAVHSGVRALAALELNGAGADVSIALVGRAPAFTIGWTSATFAGSALTSQIAPHRMAAVSDLLKKTWPPKAQAIGAATALIVEGLFAGARRHLYATTVLDGEYGERGMAAMMPLELGNGRIVRRVEPSLSTQERVEFLNGLSRRS
jgi:malate dehydrogenase